MTHVMLNDAECSIATFISRRHLEFIVYGCVEIFMLGNMVMGEREKRRNEEKWMGEGNER